ncbi:hypothetical protein EXM22_01880 [Oceanispirochaeta crateris]|uniref:Phage gp6-like head-tail connector protein n=1 Tax=Oceanispirochaeta crateris TaxID=2518645 RepID=A0A5C1QI49_9SPIO|nr:hypothetical protein [Oceanispirochaeta crateris]QEN06799.1 hypothetical protein EXM22_01880 [Oceanispirochaeta crateris]
MSKLTLLPVPEIMKFLNLDDRDENMVTLLSLSVSIEIEKYTHRILINRIKSEYQDGHNSDALYLLDYPVSEFNLLQIRSRRDLQYRSIDPTLYSLTPLPGESDQPIELTLLPGYTFPRGSNNIRISYTAGYTDETMPEDLKTAFCEIITWMLGRLKARQIGIDLLKSSSSQNSTLMYSKEIPEHARTILNSYRRKSY